MSELPLEKQISDVVSRLSDDQKRILLDLARTLDEKSTLRGESGESLLRYAASMDQFDPADLRLMAQAIEEDCERIDLTD